MPIFNRVLDGMLIVTVDGDYTPEEFRRFGAAGLELPELSSPTQVLVDMSGASGLLERAAEDVRATASFFAARSESIARVAVLAPADLTFGVMNIGRVFANMGGLETELFRTRVEALNWLRER
jgi:SpoIIAA-like